MKDDAVFFFLAFAAYLSALFTFGPGAAVTLYAALLAIGWMISTKRK